MSSKIGNTLSIAIGTQRSSARCPSPSSRLTKPGVPGQRSRGGLHARSRRRRQVRRKSRCGVAKMDTNKDGKVEMSEAMAGGFSESQVKAWDKNSDGSLDENELKAMHAIMDGAAP